MNAETLYRHIITKEGYQLLDPDSHPDDFDKPILGPVRIMQPDKGPSPIHSQLEYAYLPLGPISARDFVVMNVKDPTTLTFFSTSVLAPSPHAGGSVFSSYLGKSYVGTSMSPKSKPKKRVVRAALCSGYRCTPIPGQMNECNFEMFQFFDLGGSLPATISKFGNKSSCKESMVVFASLLARLNTISVCIFLLLYNDISMTTMINVITIRDK